MMPMRVELTAEAKANEAFERTYYEAVGHLNRKDRRTAHGRMLVAEAKNKALLAKIAALEEAIASVKGETK